MGSILKNIRLLLFGPAYRKSIWLFLVLWGITIWITFCHPTYFSFSGIYYLTLLVATIVLIIEKARLVIAEKAIRKNFITYFYAIFSLFMIPILAINLLGTITGVDDYNTKHWQSAWPTSKDGHIPAELHVPNRLPENVQVVSSVSSVNGWESYKCLVLEGNTSTILSYEDIVKAHAWYSFTNGKAKGVTLEVLNSFPQPNNKFMLFYEIGNYSINSIQSKNWKLFPWFLTGSQSVGNDANKDYYYREEHIGDGYTVYVIYNNFDQDQPRRIYFMFSPDRTRMVMVDNDIVH